MDADGPQARLHKGCRWQAIDKWVKPFPRTRWRLATPKFQHSKKRDGAELVGAFLSDRSRPNMSARTERLAAFFHASCVSHAHHAGRDLCPKPTVIPAKAGIQSTMLCEAHRTSLRIANRSTAVARARGFVPDSSSDLSKSYKTPMKSRRRINLSFCKTCALHSHAAYRKGGGMAQSRHHLFGGRSLHGFFCKTRPARAGCRVSSRSRNGEPPFR